MADLDRLLREQNPEPGQPRIPVPQYQKIDGLGYEKVTGQHGGAHAVLLSPDGQPINSGNRLPVDTGLTNNLQIIADNQGRLYGSPDGGSTWKAVKVNSGGQLELAQNVVIDNVTVNVGAEVKVNNTPEDPVNVQLSGTITKLTLTDITVEPGQALHLITNLDISNIKSLGFSLWMLTGHKNLFLSSGAIQIQSARVQDGYYAGGLVWGANLRNERGLTEGLGYTNAVHSTGEGVQVYGSYARVSLSLDSSATESLSVRTLEVRCFS